MSDQNVVSLLKQATDALKDIDSIMQAMHEGGFGSDGNLKKQREITALAQTWIGINQALSAAQQVQPQWSHCGAICRAGKRDGISCPEDNCDIEDGVRESQPVPGLVDKPLSTEPGLVGAPEPTPNDIARAFNAWEPPKHGVGAQDKGGK